MIASTKRHKYAHVDMLFINYTLILKLDGRHQVYFTFEVFYLILNKQPLAFVNKKNYRLLTGLLVWFNWRAKGIFVLKHRESHGSKEQIFQAWKNETTSFLEISRRIP